jgi:hypothetical protein
MVSRSWAMVLLRFVAWPTSAGGARRPSSGSVVISSTVSGTDFAVGCCLGRLRLAIWRPYGEVEAGDLEAVEEEAGAAGVDVVGGDTLEDLADDKLNAGAIVEIGERDFEDGAAAAASAWVLRGSSGCVVVVAEVFGAETWAAAAVAVGEDVAALVAFGCFGWWCLVLFDGGVHWSHLISPHRVLFGAKSSEEKG